MRKYRTGKSDGRTKHSYRFIFTGWTDGGLPYLFSIVIGLIGEYNYFKSRDFHILFRLFSHIYNIIAYQNKGGVFIETNFNRYIAVFIVSILVLPLAGCNQKSDMSDNTEENIQNTASDDGVMFSQSGGLYESEFQLALSTNIENGIIHYTLDGSDPTSESAQYDGARISS